MLNQTIAAQPDEIAIVSNAPLCWITHCCRQLPNTYECIQRGRIQILSAKDMYQQAIINKLALDSDYDKKGDNGPLRKQVTEPRCRDHKQSPRPWSSGTPALGAPNSSKVRLDLEYKVKAFQHLTGHLDPASIALSVVVLGDSAAEHEAGALLRQ